MIPKLVYQPFEPQPKMLMGTRPIYDPDELDKERKDVCDRLNQLLENHTTLTTPHQISDWNREYDFLLTRLESIEKRHADSEVVCCESLEVLKQNEQIEQDKKHWKRAALLGSLLLFAKTRK